MLDENLSDSLAYYNFDVITDYHKPTHQMKVLNYTFRNNDQSVYNDHFLPAIFDLSKNKYLFKISPSSNTKYWRFGLALSKEREFDFKPNEGRYNNRDLKFIEIDVGEKDGGNWVSEDLIAIGNYYIPEYESNPKLKKGYQSYSQVEFTIKKENSQSVIASYVSKDIDDYRSYRIAEFFYFKVFAWADEIDFELNVEISSESSFSETIAASQYSITDNFTPVIGAKELAKEISDLLKLLEDDKGNMFGIFGRWGRGKTFLWMEIWNNLKAVDSTSSIQYLRAEFHAWKYQDTPASWAYLYEVLADRYFCSDKLEAFKAEIKREYEAQPKLLPFWLPYKYVAQRLFAWTCEQKFKLFRTLKLNYNRIGIIPFVRFFIAIIIFSTWLFLSLKIKIDLLSSFINAVGIVIAVKLIYLYLVYKPRAVNVIKKYTSKVSFRTHLGFQAEIQKEIVHLLKAWIAESNISKKKIVLFVDDIDRCSEDRVIQVVDALKVMLENTEISRRLLVVAALDERVLKMAIRFKYENFISDDGRGLSGNSIDESKEKDFVKNLGREYIDKLFIGGVRLGELSIDERIEIFDNITKGKVGKGDFPSTDGYTPIQAILPAELDTKKDESRLKDFEELDGIHVIDTTQASEISRPEYDMIRNVLSKFAGDSTPRSIRIYYYRYLLAKKIMTYKFNNDTYFREAWIHLEPKIILSVLIFHYSVDVNAKPFEKEYDKLDNTPANESIGLQIKDWEFNIPASLYNQLLKIVEMVVPY